MDEERICAPSRPAGAGPEILEKFWPDSPVLLIGAEGTGRATWANYLLEYYKADRRFAVRSEVLPDDWEFERLAYWLLDSHKRVHPTIIWSSVSLDRTSFSQQNLLLPLANFYNENCRLILRGTLTGVSPLLASRCFKINITPPSLNETIEILCSLGLRRKDAEELAELRPGRPGTAMEFAEHLPFRNHFNGILNATANRDYTALAASLMDCPESIRVWFKEWINQVVSGKATTHVKLSKELSSELLDIAYEYLLEVSNPRLAVRAAATLIIAR